ncbi:MULTISPECIES: cytochrome P450 [Mycolicibacterium]|jgi:cytochrome P450|uniref:Cytochrome P450 n=1 Tax=Mycolicibacterium austroafricanum TaxID=39687 RepID=A0ABT8HP61_MYCAO|nr:MULTISPECIES: cytochrome P450 [Mycolicibacterium]MDN4522335.1 cytochrome P450 [Mycolicibacterium austroafricanum]MDW5613942.1 cytochrome P450 [Mycolicibacterium sp. D5.8-2]QRZ08478.1 cytochrome P450 [Mycolicibacterium austroafricanum]QZT70129.1 cytochrome P450 [Mycolicibacterium austroafricanum]QZY47910.1 cytochrome P450 [Mycolicibacterium austroafricanum]
MSSATVGSVPAFAVTDPGFSITSAEVHAARERSWYATTEYGLAVLRYEQVNRLLKHPKLRQGSAAWPAHNGVTEGPFADWFAGWILNKEGEEHHRLRRLMNPAFSNKLIGGLVPRFQALAAELIDGFAEPGRCEFVGEFAEPYAARVIAIMLGLPESEWKVIATESATIGLALGVTILDDLPRIEAALAHLYEYCDELIADRRASPREDFVTTLVNASRPEDGRLSDTELRDAMVLLIFGGFDTTRNQLGLAMQTFMAHPDQWRLLAERPELGGNAVEEVMRVNPTVRWVTREVLEDFEYEGVELAAGTTVHLYSESAGTDPRVFEPGFDITAERKPHFGFGGGVHHCLGHFVARSDMSEALPLLARRMLDPHELPGATWLPDSGNTGPITLPIGFTPAP